ncbi:transposase [Pseudomonas taiwanensis]|uniref:REP-associated tyrosine transposase n=1 Tax=Pseudomonas taiwanensis TaxID=470150 RepID=UPI0015B9A3F3|nr:transposase [Pseudomonas taiwanensis]NWL79270.1 transposase [Pseudomonas taiwanensis]
MRYQGRNLRKGRLSEPGRIYLLTTVTQQRMPLFACWDSACLVARELHTPQDVTDIQTLAWVLMPDHLHWLVQLHTGTLEAHVRRLKSRSAIGVNARTHSSGRLWQKGFHDHALRREEDVRAVARYVVANPLRAGLVEKLGDYPFWDAIWL